MKQAHGVVKNILVKVEKFFLPTDFVILDMEEDYNTPIILGRHFLITGRALIDVENGELMLRMHDEHLVFHIFKTMHESNHEENCMKIDYRDLNLKEEPNESLQKPPLPCLKESKELEVKQQAEGIIGARENMQQKPPFVTTNKILLDIELKNDINRKPPPPKGEEKKLNKVSRGWRNKKIPTKDFSPGDKVMLVYQPTQLSPHLSGHYTINKILSLEHVEIIKKDTRRKFTVRGKKLRHYDHHPP
ncbi:Retrotransposon gag protein [Arachis hypogaea]|nr:Retrotransposon gag protein [Arachis hypogaea]